MSQEESSSLVWDVERLRIATDAAGVALWSWNVDTDAVAMDKRAYQMWGVPMGEHVTFDALSTRIHSDDLGQVRTAFQKVRATQGAYEIDFRVLHSDGVRWISARGQGGDVGIVEQVMMAVFLDVTQRKQAEEAREMLAGEMSHRVKNLFAITAGITSIAARSAATTTEMARDLIQRLTSLGQAHELIRPTPGRKEASALLGTLLAVLLAPYDDKKQIGGRIRISMPDVLVGETSATTLALVVHELATNSIKYGALSAASGTLDVTCTASEEDAVIVWTERGGPPAVVPAGPSGFGTKLVARSMSGQLGGSITHDWQGGGLVVTLRMNRARVGR